MPITRRRRANPPDQPENNNNHVADQTETTAEQPLSAEPPPTPAEGEQAQPVETSDTTAEAPATHPAEAASSALPPVAPSQVPVSNGDRAAERQDYTPAIEGGRRTVRGEWFRRPPQPPPPPAQPAQSPFTASAPLQAPTHEITLPLGNMLHLAYNPGYTGSEEARSLLLHRLTDETKAGGRARCWNCGSLAIAYDRWSTRSRTFGEVGIAFCEICGVWSVM
jgi:hypothetical protein